MKKIVLLLIIIFLYIDTGAILRAEEGEIVYLEGDVEIQDQNHEYRYPDIGDFVETGDMIITESDGFVEIDREDSTIRIAGNTVFTFSETGDEGEERSAFTCITGEVNYKIAKLTGKGPMINTLAANTGVRGTEFTVFAGDDGSTLVAVEEGKVEVSAFGDSVELLPGEGVEVKPGRPPGEKFEVLRGQLNFKDWNNGKLEGFMKNPVPAVLRLYDRVLFFAGEIRKIEELYLLDRERLEFERENLSELKNEEGNPARKNYYDDVVYPLEVQASYRRLNMRYYALSALSLRRYLLTRLYLMMKVKYINNIPDREYMDYLDTHKMALELFEKKITPYLVEADI